MIWSILTAGAYVIISHLTFTDPIFVTIIILILVEVTEESRSALYAVHPGHGSIAVFSPSRGADLAAYAVIQHRASAPLRRGAQGCVTILRAVHCIFTTHTPTISNPEHHQEKHCNCV